MKTGRLFLILSVLILNTGCSTIVSKSSYAVGINSEPPGAEFIISNRAGQEIHNGVTPDTATLKSSSGYFSPEKYTIDFSKEGYEPNQNIVSAHLDPSYFGNILIGGLLGFLIIDPATGAMYQLQDTANITLEPKLALSAVAKEIADNTESKKSNSSLLINEAPINQAIETPINNTLANNIDINLKKNTKEVIPEHKKFRRISFEGVYYDIEPGTIIGTSRVGTGSRKKYQIEWSGQKNPYQYNELVELQLEAQGYPLIKYENRLLNFDKVADNDLKIGLVIEEINVDYKQSARYQNKFHKVEMQARFKISQANEVSKIYTKRFKATATDTPKSREDTINAYPKVIKKLVRLLLADPGFIKLANAINHEIQLDRLN